MSTRFFQICVGALALTFAVFFAIYVSPAALATGDILGAFGAGFVNPFSTGYAVDVILCWVIFSVWVVYERLTLGIRRGWVCILLGIIPGLAVGFGLYLIMRVRQLGAVETSKEMKSSK